MSDIRASLRFARIVIASIVATLADLRRLQLPLPTLLFFILSPIFRSRSVMQLAMIASFSKLLLAMTMARKGQERSLLSQCRMSVFPSASLCTGRTILVHLSSDDTKRQCRSLPPTITGGSHLETNSTAGASSEGSNCQISFTDLGYRRQRAPTPLDTVRTVCRLRPPFTIAQKNAWSSEDPVKI